jgi:hypothetical protein
MVPGRLPFTGSDRVLDVIHFAGGPLPSANLTKIKLIRNFPKGSPVKVLPIDYEEITMGTDSSTNYEILPYDRIVVPRDPGKSGPVVSDLSATSPTTKPVSPDDGHAKIYFFQCLLRLSGRAGRRLSVEASSSVFLREVGMVDGSFVRCLFLGGRRPEGLTGVLAIPATSSTPPPPLTSRCNAYIHYLIEVGVSIQADGRRSPSTSDICPRSSCSPQRARLHHRTLKNNMDGPAVTRT